MTPKPTLALVALGLAVSPPLHAQKEVLKPAGTPWEFLLARDGSGNAIDPATVDADFATTWHSAAGYDGPAFVSGSGYFGYGDIDGAAVATNVWDPDGSLGTERPASGQRYTVYFRTTVTPTQSVEFLRFTGIIDDGIVIYLNGTELTRHNMTADPDTWMLLSDGSGSESVPASILDPVVLPAGVPVDVSISLHNSSESSTDLGFDLLIESEEQVLPANDHFANAIELTAPLPVTTSGRTDDRLDVAGATKEPGEPNHAGDAGGASIWWKFTPPTSGHYYVSLAGSDFDTLLAVYTGTAVNALVPVSRYPNLSVPASSSDEPFYAGSRVEFEAVGGTTYYIAVDGEAGDFGVVALELGATPLRLDPLAELLPAGSPWHYLLLVDGANQPIDPESLDPDFDTTWHTAASYSGPAFSGPAPALLGYGGISGDPVVTDIWGGRDHDGDMTGDATPPSGLRFTTYYRTTFTPAAAVAHLGFEGLIDDGAAIYVNGIEVDRININGSKDVDSWTTRADSNGPEDASQVAFALDQNLPAGLPVEVAVSIHNASSSSSDLGFDLRIFSVVRPSLTVPSNDDFVNATPLAGDPPIAVMGTTEDPVFGLGASKEGGEPNHAGKTGGGSIWWTWVPTTSGRVAISLDGSTFDTLLAVYTGTAVDSLTPVSRFPNLGVPASSDDEPFYRGSRVEFDAVAGTTYHIAVDGDRGEFGDVSLSISATSTVLNPVATLLPARSDWLYLLAVDGSNQPVDPDDDDFDFDLTWQRAATYNGAAFAGPAAGPFGYGSISADPVITDIWGGRDHDGDAQPDELPPDGLRFTTYYRTTITPANLVVNLGFEALVDDGAIIYVNGTEVGRMNVDALKDANNWTTRADGNSHGVAMISNEDAPQVLVAQNVNLPAGQPVEIAVSVHNSSSGSSDMVFDMRVWSVAGELSVPPNDDFANAIALSGDPPFLEAASTRDVLLGPSASKEAGEPNHAGDPGGGSVWWSWVPDTSGRYVISLAGSNFDTLLAVYTGSAVNALTPVSRYANLSVPAASSEEPFYDGSRVEFDAVAGTTYYIAVDGAGGDSGTVAMTIDFITTLLDPVAELVPARGNWHYLLAVDGTNQPIDPESLDVDFDATWKTAAGYDGPAFAGPAPALFGYGSIAAGDIVTDIWGGRDHDGDTMPDESPPSGLRFTSYYRTSFTPASPVPHLGLEGLIDDGAIVYVNGTEVARMNVDAAKDADDWDTRADGNSANGIPAESAPQVALALGQNLPAGVPVEVAVSVHNASSSSSDMGFDLRIYSVNPPPPLAKPSLTVGPTVVAGQYDVRWESVQGALYNVEFNLGLEPDGWVALASGVSGDPSGVNSILDTPGTLRGFYRVVRVR